jgi:hypothetical protein
MSPFSDFLSLAVQLGNLLSLTCPLTLLAKLKISREFETVHLTCGLGIGRRIVSRASPAHSFFFNQICAHKFPTESP